MNVARSWLVAACALVPSLAAANGKTIIPSAAALAPSAGVAAGAVPLGLPVSGDLARALQASPMSLPLPLAGEGKGEGLSGLLATNLPSPQPSADSVRTQGLTAAESTPASRERGVKASLALGARQAITFEGSREFWDQGRRGVGELATSVGRAAEPAARPNLLGRPAEAAVAAAEPAVEKAPSRWQRMKAETKQDFRALFANIGELRRSLRLPTSKDAIRSNFRAVRTFFSKLWRLGWRVMAPVILYYLVRDGFLYGPLIYFALKGLFP